jgi:endoglucanase
MKRKLTISLLTLLVSALPMFAQANLGDVNGSSTIDIVDALLVAQYYVGLNPANFNSQAADVNASSSIDIVDALLIAQYYVGLITQFPGQQQTPAPTATPSTGATSIPTPPNISYTVNTNIRLTSVGFLANKEKQASIATSCSSFSVKRYSDDSTAYSGTISTQVSGVYIADFSSFAEEGVYYLDVASVGKSAPFEISSNVFQFPFYTVMRGFYLWRSGTAVSGSHYGVSYSHTAGHTNNGYLDYVTGSHTYKDGKQGWYDAGDYGKYIVNAGVTLGLLFKAWEHYKPALEKVTLDIPESGGSLPDYLDEIKWETDWVLKMQYPDGSGKVSHKLTGTGFCGFVMPDADTQTFYFTPWGSAATADFVAMCAMASRVFQSYDSAYSQKYLNAAVTSYNFLAANTAYVAADQSAFSTGTYESSKFTDLDDRIWAAAEMWETTGESKYLSDFETRAGSFSTKIDVDFDWDNVKNLAMITYLQSKRAGKSSSLVSQIQSSLISTADGMVTADNAQPYKDRSALHITGDATAG